MTSGFEASTAVERELVLRLASLLWRLRRATAIDTGLLQLQSEIIAELGRQPERPARVSGASDRTIARSSHELSPQSDLEWGSDQAARQLAS